MRATGAIYHRPTGPLVGERSLSRTPDFVTIGAFLQLEQGCLLQSEPAELQLVDGLPTATVYGPIDSSALTFGIRTR
jgi:hypothetical protein